MRVYIEQQIGGAFRPQSRAAGLYCATVLDGWVQKFMNGKKLLGAI